MPTLLALLLMGGCASYRPQPLGDSSLLKTDLRDLQVQAATLLNGRPSPYQVNLVDGLDLTEVGILAVINSPRLKVQRARLKLAGAQAFAAGLLPDPQINAGIDQPTGDTTGLVNGTLLGLGYDIIPLIDRQARLDAARHGQAMVRLDLLWQEWQVIQQARSLAVRMQLEEEQLTLLHNMLGLYQHRYERSAKALAEGDITLDITGTDLTALVGVLSQINQIEQSHNETRHSFNLLLGLDPQVSVPLAPLKPQIPLDPATVKARLAVLQKVRPDLLALKAGYQSQESRVRAAILAQFPSLGIGINLARDTGDVKTRGLSISLNLPLFSGNRGNIAIERATREQLHQEYDLRLDEARVDVDRLLQLQIILARQVNELQTYMPTLEHLVERARSAYAQGEIDALSFLNMESTWVNKRLEQIGLEQAIWENRIALETMLALPGYPDQALAPASEIKENNP